MESTALKINASYISRVRSGHVRALAVPFRSRWAVRHPPISSSCTQHRVNAVAQEIPVCLSVLIVAFEPYQKSANTAKSCMYRLSQHPLLPLIFPPISKLCNLMVPLSCFSAFVLQLCGMKPSTRGRKEQPLIAICYLTEMRVHSLMFQGRRIWTLSVRSLRCTCLLWT